MKRSGKVRAERDVYITSPDEIMKLPIIHAWSVVKCQSRECPAIHVFLFGADGKPMGHFPMDAESASAFVKDIFVELEGAPRGEQ